MLPAGELENRPTPGNFIPGKESCHDQIPPKDGSGESVRVHATGHRGARSRVRASSGRPGLPAFYPKMWAPEIEVFERDKKFIVRVDLPGLKKEDLKIEVTHDELTMKGKES